MSDEAFANEAFKRYKARTKEREVREVVREVLMESSGSRPTLKQVREVTKAVKRIIDDQLDPESVFFYTTGGGRRVIRDPRGL